MKRTDDLNDLLAAEPQDTTGASTAPDMDVMTLLQPINYDLAAYQTAIDAMVASYPEEAARLTVLLSQLRETGNRFEDARASAETLRGQLIGQRQTQRTTIETDLHAVIASLVPLRTAHDAKAAAFRLEAAKYGISCEPNGPAYQAALAEKAGVVIPEEILALPELMPELEKKTKLMGPSDIIASVLVGLFVAVCVLSAFGFLTYRAMKTGQIDPIAWVLSPFGPLVVLLVGIAIAWVTRNLLELEMEESSKSQRSMAYGSAIAIGAIWLAEMFLEAYGLFRLSQEKAAIAARMTGQPVQATPLAFLVILALIVTTPYFVYKALKAYNDTMPRLKAWRERKAAERKRAEALAQRASACQAIEALCRTTPRLRDIGGIVAQADALASQIEPLEAREELLRESLEDLEGEPELPALTQQTLLRLRTGVETLERQLVERLTT